MKGRVSVLILLLSVVVSSINMVCASGDVSNYFGKINPQLVRNLEKNHLAPAIKRMQTGDLYDVKGQKKEQNFRWAFEDLDFVLRYVPNHPKALEFMELLCLKWGKPQRVIPYYVKAIKSFPRVHHTYILYGKFLLRSGYPKAALSSFKQAFKLKPKSPVVHYSLAEAYLRLGQPAKAHEHATRAEKLGADITNLRKRIK